MAKHTYRNTRIWEETHRRLKVLAAQRGVSVCALLDGLATAAFAHTEPERERVYVLAGHRQQGEVYAKATGTNCVVLESLSQCRVLPADARIVALDGYDLHPMWPEMQAALAMHSIECMPDPAEAERQEGKP